jgi:hypothetical protein
MPIAAPSNPWLSLPTDAPFVLDVDGSAIHAFNEKAKADHRIELDLLPEPYVGRTDAPIVLLLLNPGVSDDDFALHRRTDFRERLRACRQESVPCPNYYLDPAVTGPGASWMARVLRRLLAEFGAQTVANGVTSYEYFPYHTRRFAHHRVRVPSQEYTFDLLRLAMERDAAIFITRGKAIWEAAVPELGGYARAFSTRSVQNVVISPKNCPDGYTIARAALRSTDPES